MSGRGKSGAGTSDVADVDEGGYDEEYDDYEGGYDGEDGYDDAAGAAEYGEGGYADGDEGEYADGDEGEYADGDEEYGDADGEYGDGEYDDEDYDDADGGADGEDGDDGDGDYDEGGQYEDDDIDGADYDDYDDDGGDDYDDDAQDDDGATQIIKEGYLTKSNPQGKRWKKRWCVLTYTDFSYFTSAEKLEKHQKGYFKLEGSELREGWDLEREPPTPYLFTLDVPEPESRAYYFCCADDDELGEWLDSVGLALGYDPEADGDGEDGDEGDDADKYLGDAGEAEDLDDIEDDGDDVYDEDAGSAAGSAARPDSDGELVADSRPDASSKRSKRHKHKTARGGRDDDEYDEYDEVPALDTDKQAASLPAEPEYDDLDAVVEDDGDGEGAGYGAGEADGGDADESESRGRKGVDDGHEAVPTDDHDAAELDSAGPHSRRDGDSTRDSTLDGSRTRSVRSGTVSANDGAEDRGSASSPAPAGQVKFTVTNASSGKVYIIVAREAKAARMTAKKIKKWICKHAESHIRSSEIELAINGDVLQDSWTGEEFGLVDGTSIIMKTQQGPGSAAARATTSGGLVVVPEAVPALRGHGEKPAAAAATGEDSAAPAAVAVAAPAMISQLGLPSHNDARDPASGPAFSGDRVEDVSAKRRSATTDPSAPVASGPEPAGPAASFAAPAAAPAPAAATAPARGDGAMQRIERRLALRRVFHSVSEDGVTASTKTFYTALMASKEAQLYLAGSLALQSLSARSDRIAWVEFSKMLRSQRPSSSVPSAGGARAVPSAAGAAAQPPNRGASAGVSTPHGQAASPRNLAGSASAAATPAGARPEGSEGGALPMDEAPSQVLMTVALDDHGSTGEITVTVGDDPLQLATNFVAQHGLSSEFVDPLLREVQATLLDAYAMELRRTTLQRNSAQARNAELQSARVGASDSRGDASKSVAAPTVARLAVQLADAQQAQADAERRLADKDRTLRRVREELVVSQQLARAGIKSQEQATDGAGELALVTRQLEHANNTIARLESRVAEVAAELAAKEKELQSQTFDKFVAASGRRGESRAGSPGTGAGAVAADAEFSAADTNKDGTLSREEYRAWARQKAAILAKANADRAKLLRENQRLRAMLGPKSQTDAVEARFRTLDEEKVKLEVEVDSLKTTNSKLQAELKSVYRRWEQDGHRWGVERRRLREQLKAHANAAAALVVSPDGDGSKVALVSVDQPTPAGATPSRDSKAVVDEANHTIAKLTQERDLILKNWSEETEILVTIWKQDKQAWAAEKKKLVFKVAALEKTSGAAGSGTGVSEA